MMPFVRSDHIRFWVVNETDFTSFPSVLFTDTGLKIISYKYLVGIFDKTVNSMFACCYENLPNHDSSNKLLTKSNPDPSIL